MNTIMPYDVSWYQRLIDGRTPVVIRHVVGICTALLCVSNVPNVPAIYEHNQHRPRISISVYSVVRNNTGQ